MKNLHHKFTAASVCTAISLVLGVSTEVKAATFTFGPATTFEVIDGGFSGSFDGRGDEVFPGNFDAVVKGTVGEAAEFVEFDMSGFSLAPNTSIRRAIVQAEIYTFSTTGLGIGSVNPGSLGIFGYVGNGVANASDFEAGVFLSAVEVSDLSAGDIITFDVTQFIDQRVSNRDAFAGFGIRALNLGTLTLGGTNFPGMPPRLIVETQALPNPFPNRPPSSVP